MAQEGITFYTILARGGNNIPLNLFYYMEKGELRVNPTGRLCGYIATATISDGKIAKRYCEALTVKMQKRYGASFSLSVAKCSEMTNRPERLREKIKGHTEKVNAWLEKHEKI